ncbi:MAG: thiamine pyrophosphate-dependent enzyme [Flavobacteriaceae bacterium]|nr:thiamine pyrophosphate-dependent enzyme [Flavobacteriaceae bacterium]
MPKTNDIALPSLSFDSFKEQLLSDYKITVLSRECSLLGRKEVLTGKAKFGIFGDGKELPQLVLSRFFKKGDFRSGYYRDQTILMAHDLLSPQQLFAALYAHPDLKEEPMSGGRQMGAHFVTPSHDKEGNWLDLTQQYNHSSDISPTAGQIPRSIGLAQASKVYRALGIPEGRNFSNNGNEIAWGTIGNASTSEGLFLEAMNAAGVLQIPLVMSVWDDGYGISVANEDQTTKGSISDALAGLQRTKTQKGVEIIRVNGWDYPALVSAYQKAEDLAREEHIPVLIHVDELTQPLGHSSSGSHERYKSKERLEWENDFDCNKKMREWILEKNIATVEELNSIEKACKEEVKIAKREAWKTYQMPILESRKSLLSLLPLLQKQAANDPALQMVSTKLAQKSEPTYKDLLHAARKALRTTAKHNTPLKDKLTQWIDDLTSSLNPKMHSHLYSESKYQLKNITSIPPQYADEVQMVDGRIIIRDNFKALFEARQNVLLFGEDVGKIGDVNQGAEGLQAQFGETRVFDTGIREATIIGQGIGMALRGLRPIAEIQYLDYVLYCLHTLSDDLASYLYRTVGQQAVPLIIRTRGHRLEGIWHSGSPMGGLIHLLRGVNLLVPRNMTQAAGFYNTLLEGDEPAIVVESLNGYRLKENLPTNLGSYRVPVGKIECLKAGEDITLVSYGSTLRLVEEAAKELLQYDIDAEVIDVQSLLPFDTTHEIRESVAKTNRLLIIDEDVPGGATGFILQQLLDEQNIFPLLDSAPQTLSAQAHRPAYGSDGDYFSKPSLDDIVEKVYRIMQESNPRNFP